MTKTPLLSVIIPVFNDAENLARLLKSVFQNDFSDFEVIVVDDASTDMRVKNIADTGGVHYHRHDKNRCVAAARNTGAKISRGDILVFFDSDIEISRDTLKRITEAYKREDGPGFLQALTSKTPANSGFGPELLALQWHFETLCTEQPTLYSLCFSIKKSLFFSLGGFDESFTGLGAEEFDFAHRLQKESKITTDRSLLVKHHFKSVFPRALALTGRTIRYTLLFLFRTKQLDSQVGRPVDIFCAIFSFLSLLFFASALLSPLFSLSGFILLFPASLFFLLFLLLQKKFLTFLIQEKGLWFSLGAVPATYLWAFASGTGIFMALFPALKVLIRGYQAPLLLNSRPAPPDHA